MQRAYFEEENVTGTDSIFRMLRVIEPDTFTRVYYNLM